MLTITFMKNAGRKTVVSCDSYDVDNTDNGLEITVYKGFGEDSKSDYFLVHPHNLSDAYSVAYVTNLAGKTIDRIGG